MIDSFLNKLGLYVCYARARGVSSKYPPPIRLPCPPPVRCSACASVSVCRLPSVWLLACVIRRLSPLVATASCSPPPHIPLSLSALSPSAACCVPGPGAAPSASHTSVYRSSPAPARHHPSRVWALACAPSPAPTPPPPVPRPPPGPAPPTPTSIACGTTACRPAPCASTPLATTREVW